MNANFLIFFSLLLFFSHSITAQNAIAGKYVNRDEISNIVLHLYPDSTFEYIDNNQYSCTQPSPYAIGKWSVVDHHIYLETFAEDIGRYNYSHKNVPHQDSLYIQVVDEGGAIPFATVKGLANDTLVTGSTTNVDGIAILPRQDIETLKIAYVGYPTVIHPIQEDEGNSYVFDFGLTPNYHFGKKVFRLKGRNLIGMERRFRQWK